MAEKSNKAISWDEMQERWKNRSRREKVWDWITSLPSGINDAWWAVIHRTVPKHKYHLLDTGLPPGYHDPDGQIIGAIFTTTKRFLDSAPIDWETDDGHSAACKKMTEATEWWDANQDCLDHEKDEELSLHLNNIISVLEYMWYP